MNQQIVIVTGGAAASAPRPRGCLAKRRPPSWSTIATRSTEADAVVSDIKASGGEAIAVQGDVGNEADILRLFAETDRVFGPLTGLVNNAGVIGGQERTDSHHKALSVPP